jgi:hypothetical protein
MERQDLIKENERFRTVVLTSMDQNVKMKSDNQALLKEKERTTSMNTKVTADQGICEDLSRYWQLRHRKPGKD